MQNAVWHNFPFRRKRYCLVHFQCEWAKLEMISLCLTFYFQLGKVLSFKFQRKAFYLLYTYVEHLPSTKKLKLASHIYSDKMGQLGGWFSENETFWNLDVYCVLFFCIKRNCGFFPTLSSNVTNILTDLTKRKL